MYFIICALVFLAAYLLNALTITVGYHRGLAHSSVRIQFRMWSIGSWDGDEKACVGGGDADGVGNLRFKGTLQ